MSAWSRREDTSGGRGGGGRGGRDGSDEGDPQELKEEAEEAASEAGMMDDGVREEEQLSTATEVEPTEDPSE